MGANSGLSGPLRLQLLKNTAAPAENALIGEKITSCARKGKKIMDLREFLHGMEQGACLPRSMRAASK
jgi:hypothetical protein